MVAEESIAKLQNPSLDTSASARGFGGLLGIRRIGRFRSGLARRIGRCRLTPSSPDLIGTHRGALVLR